MSFGSLRFRLALALTGAFIISPAHSADTKDQDRQTWEPVLRQQVKSARSCAVDEILFANVMELGKERVLEGRLRCHDGREFTFTRKHEHQKFEFELCEPAVC